MFTKSACFGWLVITCIIVNIIVAVVIFSLTPVFHVKRKCKGGELQLPVPFHGESASPDGSPLNVSKEAGGGRVHADFVGRENALSKLMPAHLRAGLSSLPVRLTAEDFRKDVTSLTGNPLIDGYRGHDVMLAGEAGRGVVLVGPEKDEAEVWQQDLGLNVLASDLIPLNRNVPDSRLKGCDALTYPDTDLLVSVIVPFHNEWPSVLLRTVYSLVNRTPRKHLLEILLVDDCSDNEVLGLPLEQYVQDYFPRGLVRLVRMPMRGGLIKARMAGFTASQGDVLVFLDSHMEVSVDWLTPLLAEVADDPHNVAMSVLDYIDAHTLQYNYNRDFFVRYGFDWRLFFFETLAALPSDASSRPIDPVPGAMMVGAAFAIDRRYFEELGGYDEGMEIWGGENIEMSWRVWMCGGRLVHVPCSHVGHIARAQPYKFPDGVHQTKLHNYKRAAEVWMGPYKKFLYENYPELKTVDAGDLSQRVELRHRLHCAHNFTWYLDSLWPVLTVYDQDATAWGSVVNNSSKRCLDNRVFAGPLGLYTDVCHFRLLTQGFSLTHQGILRTTIHCVVVPAGAEAGHGPTLQDCVIHTCDTWHHTQEGLLLHDTTGLCVDEDHEGPVMAACDVTVPSQKWHFTNNAPFLGNEN